jgi:RNA polymerase sigma-70 factor, ECF subfamily
LRRHYDRIFALCRRLTGNEADALDAAQEALIAITRGLPRFDGRAAFTTWAHRIATNACLDEMRRRKRRPDPVDDLVDVTAKGLSPEDEVAGRLDLDAALVGLPLEFRVAVVLRDVCRLDYAEIATVLDIPAGTVRSRIARGRAAVARSLAGNPTPGPERPTARP